MTHRRTLTKKADAAITTQNLLVKSGTDADHIAANGVNDLPLGVCLDTPSAAEDNVSVQMLGNSEETALMVASEAIAMNALVYTAASGKISTLASGVNGTYYCVGRALEAATADGDEIEVETCFPVAETVTGN